MATRDLTLILKAKDEASRAMADAADGASKASDLMKGAALAASAAIGTAMVGMAKSSIDAASDLNESMSKSSVVFGDFQADMQEFYAGSAKNLGLARQQAAEAAGTFGNLFTAMGIGQKPAADMSKQILTLSADLASFNNLDPTEVLEKLRSGLTGETEPLKSLGVNLNAAAVEAKAMEMGLASSAKELSASAKAQATLALIMEQTTTAQGDFARTSDGLANSQRILKAEMGDLQAEIGTQLLPVALELAKGASSILHVFQQLSPELKTAIVVVGGLMAAVGPVAGAFGAVQTILGAVIPMFTALNAVLLANPIGLVVIALAALTAGFLYAYNNSEDFRRIVDQVAAVLKDKLLSVVNTVGGAIEGFGEGFAAVKKTIDGFIDTVKKLIDALAKIPGSISLPSIPGISGVQIPGFQSGGVVPGALGAPMLAMVHGGETITPAGRGGVGNIVVYVTVQGSVATEMELAEAIRERLIATKSRNYTTGL